MYLPSEINVRLNRQEETHNYTIIKFLVRAAFSGDPCYRGKGKSQNSCFAFRLKSTLTEAFLLTGTVPLPSGNEMKMMFAEGGLVSEVHFTAIVMAKQLIRKEKMA